MNLFRLKSITKVLCLLLISGLFMVVMVGCQGSTTSSEGGSTEGDQASTAPSEGDKTDAISIGTGSIGSVFYVLCVGMADLITKEANISANAEPMAGSDATVRAVADRVVEFGMVNASSGVSAYLGENQFKEEGRKPLRLVAVGHQSLRQLVVRKDRNINTPEDLVSKNIAGRRRALQDVELVFNAILEAYGIPKEQVNNVELGDTEETEAVAIGTVDGAIAAAGIRASDLIELSEGTDVKFISIPEDKLSLILDKLGPAFIKGTIPANSYRGQTEDVSVPAIPVLLLVNPDVPEETVYQVAKTIFGNPDKITALHAEGDKWTLENTLKNFPIPFHSGAIKYFKEINAWNDELENRQNQLSQ
ncbi:TAXI family TRAP transporter solute-binding subunit [Candidatus Formimonas warabiya]|uniref:TAXI family TRAP transporter solute-binding subunit n=1 Tax=Formimonas warabiya TaxID=1761012 RepID=A0A3G1KMP1_FORW1|nr:TAXI family TRAP transporter solute-binding subunit [Candidatus Formimonas warabiya]ATW23731.1 hypothetical protein DCMF_02005 [Candidatus Formimonas warabiya]